MLSGSGQICVLPSPNFEAPNHDGRQWNESLNNTLKLDDAVKISNLEIETLHDSCFSTTVGKLPERVQTPCPTVKDWVLTLPHVQGQDQGLELAQSRPRARELDFLHMVG